MIFPDYPNDDKPLQPGLRTGVNGLGRKRGLRGYGPENNPRKIYSMNRKFEKKDIKE